MDPLTPWPRVLAPIQGQTIHRVRNLTVCSVLGLFWCRIWGPLSTPPQAPLCVPVHGPHVSPASGRVSGVRRRGPCTEYSTHSPIPVTSLLLSPSLFPCFPFYQGNSERLKGGCAGQTSSCGSYSS